VSKRPIKGIQLIGRKRRAEEDLVELECALNFAKQGKPVNWDAAGKAWMRLKDVLGTKLPQSYWPMFLDNTP
jgi:hypothetical protein